MMNKKIPLFKLIFTSKNLSIPEKIEYLKCKTFEELKSGAKQWIKSQHSEYYKYDHVEIQKDFTFDEIITVKVDLDLPTKSQIISLEGKLQYHKQATKKIKVLIHEMRGDYDNPNKYTHLGNCAVHKNCNLYQKGQTDVVIHRRGTVKP